MFRKKGEGGVVAYLSSDEAAVVWQDGEEEQRVGELEEEEVLVLERKQKTEEISSTMLSNMILFTDSSSLAELNLHAYALRSTTRMVFPSASSPGLCWQHPLADYHQGSAPSQSSSSSSLKRPTRTAL
ncbi:hypothetical protein FH972_016719 [Carpinus fangiana]|uniref:Uncharacterized protein n=1 Tax=Carpinus fangiana TaxID=176857 RepID=A0A5N6RIS7_9ROSI|nr:hypothetical protein FH972_016719 [Carpinus fangiana]